MTLSRPLLALVIASFGIGTSEFVIMGLLPNVAGDLNVSIPSAGLLVSFYALAVMAGAPVMAVLLSSWPRKQALLVLLALFILGNLACGLAPGYGLLMAARIVTALCHGAFFGIGAVVATTLVPPAQRSRAIAVMFSGLTVANILGVPLGTALGQWAGWRASFLAIVPIGIVAAIAIARWLPRATGSRISLAQEFSVLRRPQMLLAMTISVMSSASLFATFTFITPILEQVTHLSPHAVTWVLLLFGVGITGGNLLGGRLADWRQLPVIIGILASLVALAILFGLSAAMTVPAVAMVFIWGAVQFANGAPLQTRVVDQGAAAPNLASTLNQSAFNGGNALGAWLGAEGLRAGMGYAELPYLSAALAATGLLVAVAAAWLARHPRRQGRGSMPGVAA